MKLDNKLRRNQLLLNQKMNQSSMIQDLQK